MVVDLGLLVPLENENRWTDLIAVLIATDPATAAAVLGLDDVAGRRFEVAREERAGKHERADLLIRLDGQLHTVCEAKVLSGLGHQQLERYSASYPGAASYLLLHPARLVIDPGAGSGWRAVSWEALLTAFATSTNSWVAETAQAWLEHLQRALPHAEATTRWNALEPGDPVPLVMRTRMSWVYSHLRPPAPLIADFMASGGSKGWVARLQMPAQDGHVLAAEVEDTSARGWPARFAAGAPNPVAGPRVWVGLRQHDVAGSENFDWHRLAALWPHMRQSRSDWLTTRPGLPAAHDRAAWKAIGAPAGLGYGFGHREAVQRHVCMFGARIALPADIALGELVEELDGIGRLLLELAAAPAAPTATPS